MYSTNLRGPSGALDNQQICTESGTLHVGVAELISSLPDSSPQNQPVREAPCPVIIAIYKATTHYQHLVGKGTGQAFTHLKTLCILATPGISG